MIREPNMPAILVEGGFMDSRTDIDALRDDNKLKAQGEGIARGIAKFLDLPLKEDVPKVKVGVATMKQPPAGRRLRHHVRMAVPSVDARPLDQAYSCGRSCDPG